MLAMRFPPSAGRNLSEPTVFGLVARRNRRRDQRGSCCATVGPTSHSFLARRLPFVAGLPLHFGGLAGRLQTQHKTKLRYFCEACEIPVGVKLVTRLVVVMLNVIVGLRCAPRHVVAGKLF